MTLKIVMPKKDYVVDNLVVADSADLGDDFDNDFEVSFDYDSNSSTGIFVTKVTKCLRSSKLFCSSVVNWFLIPLIAYSQLGIVDKAFLVAAIKMAFNCLKFDQEKVKICAGRFGFDLASPNLLMVGGI